MKRYSLRFLFAVSTLLIVFLGYSQWRRQNILGQVHEIQELGGLIELPNDYRDSVWQRRPTKGWYHTEIVRQKMEAAGITEVFDFNMW